MTGKSHFEHTLNSNNFLHVLSEFSFDVLRGGVYGFFFSGTVFLIEYLAKFYRQNVWKCEKKMVSSLRLLMSKNDAMSLHAASPKNCCALDQPQPVTRVGASAALFGCR